ncbi:DNRLRE domain-containing protein [Kitasatospora purpeofusca]|uniref:DNRLRE domain-containing protein n=1 Tax=Kitasatospora purpeofusca TaxID=67352 RepID=UPI003867EEE0
MAAALGATMLTAAQPAAAAPAAPAPELSTGTGPAPDVPSARLAARLRGTPVEALGSRSPTSTTWANPDGTLTTETAAGPVRYRSGETWVDVDVTFARQADGSVRSKAHPRGLALSGAKGTRATSFGAAASAPAQDLLALTAGDRSVSMRWKGGLPEPRIDGAKATYPEALPGADLVIEATRTGYEQSVVLKRRPAEASTFTLPIRAPGVTAAQQPDGSVLFTETATGRELSTMPAPVMWDDTVDPKSLEHTRKAPVGLSVVQSGDDIELRLAPDQAFLADPATRFPVTVDPSDTVLSDVFDTYVQQGETTDQSTSTDLKIGWPGDYADPPANTKPRVARSFVTWDMAPIKDALVSKATLSLFNYHSWDCTKPTAWEVWDTGPAKTTTRWTTQPTWYQRYAGSTATKGQNCANGGYVDADVTSLLQYWAGQTTVTKQGLGIRATNEGSTLGWKRFYSGNAAAAQIPKLSVTYNYRPKTGTDLQAGPPFFAHNGGYVVNTLTPTLRDTFTDGNNDRINGTFQIVDAATDAPVGGLLVSPYVPGGQPAPVTVPAGLLANGKTYRFRSNPYDGTHYNLAWSAWKTFTVDTAAPSAPASVASTDYPTSGWVKGIGQTGSFTVTPPATDQQWIEWSLDGVAWTKVPTNGSTAPVTLQVTPAKGGTNTLQVRAVDPADNRSEAVPYVFHVGAGGITGITDGQRTPARLPLTAEADASRFDAVTFSWRRSDADAWAPIPLADVSAGGGPVAAWPVALTGGAGPALTWTATATVNPDGAVQVRADFTGPGGAAASGDALKVVVDRTADVSASTSVGPGSVNLLTGNYTLSGTDASFFDMAVTRTAGSRVPDAGARQDGQVAIFGKEWLSGTVATRTNPTYTAVRRTSDTSVDLVTKTGTQVRFTANAAADGWVAEPGSEELTLTGGFAGTFTLSGTDGTVTTFARVDPSATAWTVTTSLSDGLADSTTEVVSEAVTAPDGRTLARPRRIIAATSAVTLGACEANPATRGCRVLEFDYAKASTGTVAVPGDHAGQVSTIRLWATAPGATVSTPTEVARYAYDDLGRLRETWDPRISPALKTAYAYDGAGHVTGLTPAGQLPWTFGYGRAGGSAAAGDGMLLSVSRPTLTPGSADQTDGTATTTVVYGVPVTGSRAPYNLGAGATATWGQTDNPTDATAVFPADQVPASSDGPALAASAYTRAAVSYLDASGRLVDSAQPGGGISAAEFDRFGNPVRQLTAANRALALGANVADRAVLADLGIIGLPSAERARLLSTQRAYGADGTRETETVDPLHRVALAADLVDGGTTVAAVGNQIAARTRTVKEYDAGRPTDGTAVTRDQVTRTTVGAQPRSNQALFADSRVTGTGYDWTKGLATGTTQDPDGLNLTRTTAYDAQGRVTRTTQPASTGTDAGATVTTYYTGDGTGPCGGKPEWADSVCTTGPAAGITGGGGNPAQLPTKTSEYGLYRQPTRLTETADGVTRTTVHAYDAAGRPTTVTVTGGTGAAVPAVTTGYDPSTGQATTTATTGNGTVTRAFDRLGRQTSYTDADGAVTTTTYDALNRAATVTDSAPSSTTYVYDTAIDPRGVLTSTADSVAGTFTVRYDADGTAVTQGLPGGYTARQSTDPTGTPTSLTYTRDSDGLVFMADAVATTVHDEWTNHTGSTGQSSAQTFGYDAVGRLVSATDTINGVCTSRTYGYDRDSNRTAQSSTAAAPGADCTTTGGTSAAHTYDSADRLTDPGYGYDAFGRTTAQPGGVTNGYYANDLVQAQATPTARQTWTLDPMLRRRGWTAETGNAGTWTQTGSKLNHYGDDGDNPRWIVENTGTGAVVRSVSSAGGGLGATTSSTGDAVLALTNLHNDIAVLLPLTGGAAPTVLRYDEFGNPAESQPPARYGWLGAGQRSAETPTGNILMGARLYQPSIGRFLQSDPVLYGSANAYDYADQNPLTYADPSGLYRMKFLWGWTRLGVRFDKDYTMYAASWGAFGAQVLARILPKPYGSILKWGGAWISAAAGYALLHRKCLYAYISYYGWVSFGTTSCF